MKNEKPVCPNCKGTTFIQAHIDSEGRKMDGRCHLCHPDLEPMRKLMKKISENEDEVNRAYESIFDVRMELI